MKILVLCPSISGSGGLQRVVINWANNFCKTNEIVLGTLEKNSHIYYPINSLIKIQYLSFCRYKPYLLISGLIRKLCLLGKIELNSKMKQYFFYPSYRLKAYKKYISLGRFEIVIAIGMDMSIILSMIKHQIPQIKAIGWEHSTFNAYFKEKGRYSYSMEKIAADNLKNLNNIIVLTKSDIKNYKNNLNCDAINIYNPLSFITEQKSSMNNKKLLFVGRLDIRSKGIDILLRIISIVFEQIPDWKLVIVGGGENKKVHSLISNLSLKERVEMVGDVKNVEKYYNSADLFLSTSRWEGFGLVITEAMEYGLPVIAFDNLGPREILEDGVEGFLIPDYNEELFIIRLISLMNDFKLRKSFSESAKKKASNFYPHKIYKEWEKYLY